jgi:hypothetical protein
MTSLEQLVPWVKNIAKEYPTQRQDIFDFLSLCLDEIEEGGSQSHEVQLCYNDICDLVGIDE